MSKVRVKNVEKVFKSINNRLRNATTDKQFVDAAAKKVVADNQASLRKGRDPITGEKYKGISKASQRYREYIAKYNATNNFYQKNRSNLTLTGQLGNAIQVDVTRPNGNVLIKLEVNPKRKPYRGKGGRKLKTPTNTQIAKWQTDEGRRVLGISDKTTKQVLTQLKQFLRRKLR